MVWNKVVFSPKFLENVPQYHVCVAGLWSHRDSKGSFCEKLPRCDSQGQAAPRQHHIAPELAYPKLGKGEGKWTRQLERAVRVSEKNNSLQRQRQSGEILGSVSAWVLKRHQTNKFSPTSLINKGFSSDSEALVSPLLRLWFLPSLRFKLFKGQSCPRTWHLGPGKGGFGRRHSLGHRQGSPRTYDLFPAGMKLPAESNFTFFLHLYFCSARTNTHQN